jgi:hypothetical protein
MTYDVDPYTAAIVIDLVEHATVTAPDPMAPAPCSAIATAIVSA